MSVSVADERTPLTAAAAPDDAARDGKRSGRSGNASTTTLRVGVFAMLAMVLLVVGGPRCVPAARRIYLEHFGSLDDVSDEAKAILNCKEDVNRVQPSVYLLGVQKAGFGGEGGWLHSRVGRGAILSTPKFSS